jgi:archaellum biogenesis protein FlaJ (TadC family)
VYGEKLPRFEKIDKLAKNNFSDMFRDTLKTIYIDLFELFTAIARIFTKADGSLHSTPTVVWKLSWQPFTERFANFLDRLSHHASVLNEEQEFLRLTLAMETHSLQTKQLEFNKEYEKLIKESNYRWDTNKRGKLQ